jgi:hypothetical protein
MNLNSMNQNSMNQNSMNPRFDLILSYWIFAWFILYIYDVVPYSPHLALVLALLFEFGILFAMIYNRTSNYYIALFVIITIIIKGIPLYILRNETIDYASQMFYMGVLMVTYVGWLLINKKNPIDYYKTQIYGLSQGKETTPAISIIYPYLMRFLGK